jgi:AcrR family transcriptional regulator
MSRPDTREVILDAAEGLFARSGYHGSSVRAITAEAGVNLASVNYNFGSKEELLKAVLERRFLPINQAREEKLQAVLEKAGDRPPALRDIIRAFVEPGLALFDDEETVSNMMAIVMTALAKKGEKASEIVHGIMLPVTRMFHAALRRALPACSDSEVMWKMHFMIGAFVHTVRFSSADRVPGGMKNDVGRDALADMLVKFIEAGLKAK